WLDEAIEVFDFSLENYNLQIEQKTIYVLIDHLLNHQFAIMRQEALNNQKGEDPKYLMREKEKPSKNVFKHIFMVWNKIRKSGVEPDASSYGRMLFGIAWKDPFHAKYILLNMIAAGHKPIQRDLDRVINNLIGSGSFLDYKDVLEAVKSVNMLPSAKVLGNLVHESTRFKKLEFLNLFYKEMVKSESYPIDPASESYLDLINESIAKDQIHQALNLYNIMRSEGLCPHPVVTLTVFEGLYTKKSMLVAARELAETFPRSNMPKLPEILHYIVAGFVWHGKRYVAYRMTKLFLQQKIMPLRYTIDVIGNAYLDRNMPYRAEPYFASLLRAKNQEPQAEQIARLMTSLYHRKDYIRLTRWLPRLEAIPGVRENAVSMLALLLGHTLVGTSEDIMKAWNDLIYLPCPNKKLRVAVVAICNGLSRLDDLDALKKQWDIFRKSQTLRLDEQQYRHYISILCDEFNDPDEAMRVLVEHMSEKNVPPAEETIQVIALNLKNDGRPHREILEIMEPVREAWPLEYNKWLNWQITHLDKL
ncbi:12458_t:CDS:1, partial [Ambispora leptoticha]